MNRDEYRRNFELEDHYWWFVGVRRIVESLIALSGVDLRAARVLDLGCGTGALLKRLSARAANAVGADYSREALVYCVRRGLKPLLCSDAAALALASGCFDLVTAIGIIEHLDEDNVFLREVWRVLKPGGILILLTSAHPLLWSVHDVANQHRRRYRMQQLEEQIQRVGFSTIRFSYCNMFLFPFIAFGIVLNRGGRDEPQAARRLLPRIPAWLNAILTGILSLEAPLIRRSRLPWGISMAGAFRKPL